MLWILRFLLGWITWIVIVVWSTVCSIILWNWGDIEEDMEEVIACTLGRQVWNTMMFKK